MGHECYSFTDEFFKYNEVPIAKEDQAKTTFLCEHGRFAYRVMPLSLRNAPAIFSRIFIKAFQEYLYKTMVVYFDDWKIYILLKEHVKWLHLMLEHCKQI